MIASWGARAWVLFAAVGLVFAFAPGALAQGGQSTPGVSVTAQNPGTAPGSDLRITLTAHSERSTAESPSCRPQDANLRCWGDLVLRIPDAGGLTLSGLQVHRVAVAVGDISCGDEGDEGDSCDGHEGGDMAATAAGNPAQYPIKAQVNGVSVLTRPGEALCWLFDSQGQPQVQEPCPVGTQVQVKITLTDNGPAQYADEADVVVNQFVPGNTKPLIYDTGTQAIQQVQIHWLGGPPAGAAG